MLSFGGRLFLRYSLKIQLSVAVLLVIAAVSVLLSGDVSALWQNVRIFADDECIAFEDAEPILRGGSIYAPVIDVLNALSLKNGYTDYYGELTVKNNGNTYVMNFIDGTALKNGEDCGFDIDTEIIDSKPYAALRDFCRFIDCEISWDSQAFAAKIKIAEKPNPMTGTEINDEYRFYDCLGKHQQYAVFSKGGDKLCAEMVDMTADKRSRYSSIVNSIAEAVPEAETYNIVLPTASDFYAPSGYSTNHLGEIYNIYQNLSDDVTPINAVRPLSKHLGENIFFKTDHHWTQLGAYFVYKEFLNYTGQAIDPPEAFRRDEPIVFQGSFLEYLNNTELYDDICDTYDVLELYYPQTEFEGKSYYDAELNEYIADMIGINPAFANYDALLEGDYPVEVFKTNAASGKKLCIIKESFGNAFAAWALNNYSEVYVIDYRCFNNYYGREESSREFKISEFYEKVRFDDLVIMNYPVSVNGTQELDALAAIAG